MILSKKAVGLTLLQALFSICIVVGQTPEERQRITATYQVSTLNQLAAVYLQKAEQEKAEAVAYASLRNIPIIMTLEDGGYAELQRVLDDGTLLYYRTDNVDAAKSTRTNFLNTGGGLGLNLDGQNMIAGVWDGGHARASHQEYQGSGGPNRVTIMDGPLNLNFHAAHVTGTITASGVDPLAKGMAPQSLVHGYDWNSDLSEATTAAAGGLLISNHSYGYDANSIPDQWFGAYREDAQAWDNLMYNAPYYLSVSSAGNDGTSTANGAPLEGLSGFDKLNGRKTGKNVLVVANAQDASIDVNGDLISVSINSTSSQGPTDDLRIKPDLAGNGTGVYSTLETGDTAYGSLTGTSMAAPNVTGSLLLLQQHFNNLNGAFMRSATLKGLALHTADDAGTPGPNAVWGWGLLNSKRAAETITANGTSSMMQELVLSQGQTYSIQVEADGINDLIASISWTDPAGTVNNDLNSPIPALVNDLDIRVTQGGNTYYPWRLTSVLNNANDGDNFVDPFERVDVIGASGTYTITVTHKGTLSGGSQHFSLIVTGLLVNCTLATVPVNIQATNITATTAYLNWDPVPGAQYDVRYRETGTSQWETIDDLNLSNTVLTGLVLLTDYEVQVRSKCPGDTPTAFSTSVFFTTEGYCDAGAVETDFEKIGNVTFNTINNNSTSDAGYEDFTHIYTPVSRGSTYFFSASSFESYPDDQVIVWIDFNQNGDFSDPGEQVLMTPTSGSPWTGFINIPADANLGATRMRVRLHDAAFGGNTNPCGNSTYGQVEDYTVIVYDDYLYYDSQWVPQNPSGIATTADNILVVNGQTSLTGTTEANNLTVQANGHLNIEGILHANGDVLNQGTLVFVSTQSTTAQLAPFSGTFTGEVQVERYIPARRAFRLLSTPVTTTGSIHDNWQESAANAADNPSPGYGTHITGSSTGANGFDATPSGAPSLFTLNNSTQSWNAAPNTNLDGLVAGRPYRLMVRGDRSIDVTNNSATPTNTTLRTTGVLHTGPYVVSVLSETANDFNFIGNPYPAVVDMETVLSAATNINSTHYWVWDPTLGGTPTPGQPGGRGAYVAVNVGDNTSNNASSEANKYLQPGQAAFVQTIANGSASLTFEENHKAVTQPQTQVFSVLQSLYLRLFDANSYAAGSTSSDGVLIKFSDTGSNLITTEDALKFYNLDENLAIVNNQTRLSIESRALPEAGELIPLFTNQYRRANYVFEARLKEMNDVQVFLKDNFTGSHTVLFNNDTTLYAFQVDANNPASMVDDRFEIVFEELLSTNEVNFGDGFVLFPNPTQGEINIATRGIAGQDVQLSITSVLGQLVYNNTLTVNSNGMLSADITGLSNGVYILKLSDATGGQFITKFVKR
jgi:trimeric autotransporter adhesin